MTAVQYHRTSIIVQTGLVPTNFSCFGKHPVLISTLDYSVEINNIEDPEDTPSEVVTSNNENQEESLFNYTKQDEYVAAKNIEDKKESVIKSDNNIQHKKNSNGELDLDFLDIPAFLRKQAD